MDLARTVGLFAHGIPLLLSLPESDDSVEQLLHVKAQFDRFSTFGRSFAALRWLSEDRALTGLLESLPRRELVFNYIGQFDTTRSETALVRVIPKVPRSLEDRENPRDFVLQCQVGVLNGCLTALWSYSANLHAPSTIERLNRHFMAALRALAELPPNSQTVELPAARSPAADRAAS
jgi:non-ribosomal peptide synthase protein (TIGR01720 family)